MANLDTENKRRSATGIFHFYTMPPVPDGTIAALDREHATYIYAGIAASGLVAVLEFINTVIESLTTARAIASTTIMRAISSTTIGRVITSTTIGRVISSLTTSRDITEK